jgi:2-polyprenyl-3-methyl-5-hydroxy-6-metoxy-1,4-benzoquinol methylase
MTAPVSPFGASSTLVRTLRTSDLRAQYVAKAGYDPEHCFCGHDEVHLYECSRTAMRFWRPAEVAGDEAFYAELSARLPNYYRTDRWEYNAARQAIASSSARVLEVGCGRGYFLRSLEGLVADAVGLEFNRTAIANKETRFAVHAETIESLSMRQSGTFDAVVSFQVLEHVADPRSFLLGMRDLTKPGGVIAVSTPNYLYPVHQKAMDPLDLPPHHLNHFTPEVFNKVGVALNLELVSTLSQAETEQRFGVWAGPEHSSMERTAREMAHSLLGAFGRRQVPGHTVLALYRRPE